VEFKDAVFGRRSVRAYTDDPVDPEALRRVIRAAGYAPSSWNSQPWHFHVAQGAARDRVTEVMSHGTVYLDEYVETLAPEMAEHAKSFFADLGRAPVIIATSIETSDESMESINRSMATGCAVQNLLLAAQDEGLATCAVTFSFWVRDELADVFQVADDREIVALILVGHAAVTPDDPGRSEEIATFLE
jgi:coenzyme F420-0:L-glutamate ligase/coenzyme F420-1:gamma-L-glutamate ligase